VQRLIRTGVLTSSIEAIFPLEQVQEAVRRAEAPGRQGKILLRCSGSS
jgi:NADPH:quinone reductase-like Zn-dependent oxidoreductase